MADRAFFAPDLPTTDDPVARARAVTERMALYVDAQDDAAVIETALDSLTERAASAEKRAALPVSEGVRGAASREGRTGMTETTNTDKLIENVRELIGSCDVDTGYLLNRVLDALTREADDARYARARIHENERYIEDARTNANLASAQRERMRFERDVQAAIVDAAMTETIELAQQGYPVGMLMRILNAEQAHLLARHDAAELDSLADEMRRTEGLNDPEIIEWIRAKAESKREGTA